MKGDGPKDGDTYYAWIILASLIIKSNGLPYRVSNSKRKTTSPFVELTMELQNRAVKKTAQSSDALARAINRARASIKGLPEIGVSEVKNLVHKYAGATESGGDEDHKWVVDRVLEGQFVGLHKIIPKTFIEGDLLKTKLLSQREVGGTRKRHGRNYLSHPTH
jgi:hypothetical protein